MSKFVARAGLVLGATGLLLIGAAAPCVAQGTTPLDRKEAAARAKLPDEALKLAQQAEKHLKEDKPKEAIAILEQVDKKYPGHRAVSLRLAQIYDTMEDNGPALFYYRRYAILGGGGMLEDVQARVMALELMPGVDVKAEAYSKKFGEATQELATPTPKIERSINAATDDGRLVKIEGEDQLNKIAKEGLKVTPAATSKPVATPIVINTPARTRVAVDAAPSATGAKMPVSTSHAGTIVEPIQAAVRSTPAGTDEDAMLARSFRSNGQAVEEVPATPTPTPDPIAKLAEPLPGQGLPNSKPPTALPRQVTPAPPKTFAGSPDNPVIAYTSKTPASDSPRAQTFFNIKDLGGNRSTIVAINGLTESVVTFSIIPKDEREPSQAILLPGESRTFQLTPDVYELTVNVSTTDYTPITQMNTSFQYKFVAGKQYTRRFTPSNLQALN